MFKQDLALNIQQELICHKNERTNQPTQSSLNLLIVPAILK